MPHFYEVDNVCTAKHIGGWDIGGLYHGSEIEQVKRRHETLKGLIDKGFIETGKLHFVILTQEQIDDYSVDDFLKEIGFEHVYEAEYSDESDHPESGNLHMYCVTPEVYETKVRSGVVKYEKMLKDLAVPKAVDPKRQEYPNLRLIDLRQAGLVKKSCSVHDKIKDICDNTTVLHNHILIKFGVDVHKRWGQSWVNCTTDQIKDYQSKWKAELV